MAVSRRKAPKQEAPQTIDEAVALLAEYRDTADKIDELKADAASAIAKIEAARDEFAAPLDQRLKDVFRQLRAWWGVAAPSLTDLTKSPAGPMANTMSALLPHWSDSTRSQETPSTPSKF